jgi:hypothetical protein
VQAALAHLLGQKYAFTCHAVPGIRAALDLDEEAVQEVYQRLYREPLETICATRTTLADRLRWSWAALAGWLESLPPFWTAFALTLTETVGAGIVALPIALAPLAAEIGPVVHVLGSVFVVLAMGMNSIHSSLPLFNLVRERLPTKRWSVMMLPRRRGRLLLCSNRRGVAGADGDLRLGLTYLGLEASPEPGQRGGQPRFHLDIEFKRLLVKMEAFLER